MHVPLTHLPLTLTPLPLTHLLDWMACACNLMAMQ